MGSQRSQLPSDVSTLKETIRWKIAKNVGLLPSAASRSPYLSLAGTSLQSYASLWQPLLDRKSLSFPELLGYRSATF